MRLCYVAYSPLDLRSANSVQTFNTCRELARQLGDDLLVIVPRFGARESPSPFPVVKLPRIPVNKLSRIWGSGWWSFIERSLYAWLVRLALRGKKFDALYTRDIVCAYRLESSGLPVIYEVHDLEAQHPAQNKSARLASFLKHVDEQTLRRARAVVSLTETFRQELIAWGWQPADRVFVIPDAYDDAIYFPRDRMQARAELGLPSDDLLVTYAGLTFKYRGLELLLRTLKEWAEPRALLVLVGGRPFEIDDLKQQANELGIGERVRFIGRETPERTALYLAAADALVIPDTVTDSTASPLKMFEYMAMARPIVAVDRAALREILTPGCALFFPPGDSTALTAALTRAAGAEGAQLGAQAHARVAGYTYARRAEKIISAVNTTLGVQAALGVK